MAKPATLDGYTDEHTIDCERVLVTLLRALGPWKLLADAPEISGGKVQPLPTHGTISALNVPHSSIVFDLHQITEIQAELLGGAGAATELVRHANESLTILRKRFAQDDKIEGYRKDSPVAVARFELGDGDEPGQREARLLRQRESSDLVEQLLARIG